MSILYFFQSPEPLFKAFPLVTASHVCSTHLCTFVHDLSSTCNAFPTMFNPYSPTATSNTISIMKFSLISTNNMKCAFSIIGSPTE